MSFQQQPAMQVQPIQATPVVAATSNDVYPNYAAKAAIGLGMTQIIIGSICIFFNIFLVIPGFQVEFAFGYVGTGFWAGVIVRIYLKLQSTQLYNDN